MSDAHDMIAQDSQDDAEFDDAIDRAEYQEPWESGADD